MRIRRRLALLGAGLATGTVVLFAVLLIVLGTYTTPADQDRSLDLLAERAAAEYVPAGAEPALFLDAATSLDEFVVVVDGDNDVVYSQARIGGELPSVPEALIAQARRTGIARATTTSGGVELRMSARPLVEPAAADAAERPVVVAAQPTAFARDQLGGLQLALAIAAVFTAISGAIASWVVSGQALRPLQRLAATAAEIARTGDITRRLPTAKRRDEVGALADGFNAMMTRLEGSQTWLAASLDQQRRFVADASHELRTPLTTIRANAGFLAERPEAADADRAEALRHLRQEADRMAALVDDLLVLARTDSLPRPSRDVVDLAGIAADVAQVSGAGMVTAPGPHDVVGDEVLLRRMVRCLVDNGMVHGGGAVGMRVHRSPEPPWVVLTVWDGGPGFPLQALPHVFERFYRADPARSGPGSGLGLAIAASIARIHGGVIEAANNPSGGAVVTIHLPAAPMG